jgi:tRNA-2-methylthio-N6-dimethylallyladenosine synthase
LDDLQSEILTEKNARYLNERVEILVEGKQERTGRWFGRTRTDRLVFFEAPGDWLGQMAQIKVTWAGPWSLVGEVAVNNIERDSE